MFVTGVPAQLTLDAGLAGAERARPRREAADLRDGRSDRGAPGVERDAAVDERSASCPARGDGAPISPACARNLKPGDALVFVGDEFLAQPTPRTNWDFRLLDRVELADAANDRTLVSWSAAARLDRFAVPTRRAQPRVYVLRKRAAVFGHNAPMWRSMTRGVPHGLSRDVRSAARTGDLARQ